MSSLPVTNQNNLPLPAGQTMKASVFAKATTRHVVKGESAERRVRSVLMLYWHGHVGTDLSVLSSILFKEPVLVSFVGASGGFENNGRPSVYTRALNLIEQKQIDVAPLITHRYTSFADVERALANEIHDEDYVKGVVVL